MGLSNPVGGVMPGVVGYFAASAAPAGWLKANGAAVSRTAYALLFASIGTTYGAGDGSTTFNLPELRGEFLRCLSDGRAVDTGRALGSAQGDVFKSHSHSTPVSYQTDYGPIMLSLETYNNSGPLIVTTATGDATETRPRNIALLACIKY